MAAEEVNLSDLFALLVNKMVEGLETNPTPALMTAIAKFLKDNEITCSDSQDLTDLTAGMQDSDIDIEKKFNG